MKPIAIVQARMSSTRLPGKVLKELAGQTVLHYVVRRCQLSRRLADVVFATTDESADDPIAAAAQSMGIGSFAGVGRMCSIVTFRLPWASARTPLSASPAIVRSLNRPSLTKSLASHDRTGAEFIYTDGFPRGSGDAELVTLPALQRACASNATGGSLLSGARHHLPLAPSGTVPASRGAAPQETRDRDYRLCVDEADDLRSHPADLRAFRTPHRFRPGGDPRFPWCNIPQLRRSTATLRKSRPESMERVAYDHTETKRNAR